LKSLLPEEKSKCGLEQKNRSKLQTTENKSKKQVNEVKEKRYHTISF
jgi:hypothetical protein